MSVAYSLWDSNRAAKVFCLVPVTAFSLDSVEAELESRRAGFGLLTLGDSSAVCGAALYTWRPVGRQPETVHEHYTCAANTDILEVVFRTDKAVIGMIHVPALPGAPLCCMNINEISRFVLTDAAALAEGDVDGLMIENFGDVPFFPARVPAHTIAFLSRLAFEIKTRVPLPLGINVLRNDGMGAIAIATAVSAEFVRINVYTGARVADQGILQGESHEIARYRRALGAATQIWADVAVKHSAALGDRSLRDEVEDTVERGLADAVVVSGSSTGKPTSLDDVHTAKGHARRAAVYVGSGVDESTVEGLLEVADGAIVGTAFKRGAKVSAPVDPARVRTLVSIVRRKFTGDRLASH